jgi:hypothetical protein
MQVTFLRPSRHWVRDAVRRDEGDLFRPDGEGMSGTTEPFGQRPVDHIRRADEAGDKGRLRVLIDLGGRADLFEPSVGKHGQPVTHRQSLVLVMGDIDEGDADFVLDALQLDLHPLPQLEVERPEGLVQEQDTRPVDEGPGQGDPLPLTAGKLGDAAAVKAVQADHGQCLGAPPAALGLADAFDLEPVFHIGGHVQVREESVVLKDGVDVTVIGR